MKMKKNRLPDAELSVMQAIWANTPPVSTMTIYNQLCQEKEWNVSAVQTLLTRLTARGFVTSEKMGKCRYYTPLVEQEDYIAYENRSFLDRMNGSSLTKFVAALYDSKGITDEDLNELHRFLEEKAKH